MTAAFSNFMSIGTRPSNLSLGENVEGSSAIRQFLNDRKGSVAVIVTQTNRLTAMRGEPAVSLLAWWTAEAGQEQSSTN